MIKRYNTSIYHSLEVGWAHVRTNNVACGETSRMFAIRISEYKEEDEKASNKQYPRNDRNHMDTLYTMCW